MIAGVLHLSRSDIKALKITDAYSLHRVVYNLFADVRNDVQKEASLPSGFLFADKGGDRDTRKILFLSNRPPHEPVHGQIQLKQIPDEFLNHVQYGFEVTVNPSRRDNKSKKLIPLRTRADISQWFVAKSTGSWGFEVDPVSLQVIAMGVQQFEKDGKTVTHGSATLKGVLTVVDRDCFINSFSQGIGRGRAFGFGLLQIVPLSNSSNQ